jgi:competence protein ComGC
MTSAWQRSEYSAKPVSASRRALTLLELVVAITIVAILIGLLLPAIQRVRATASRIRCVNQMRQVTIAVHNFAAARDGRLPAMNIQSPYTEDGAVLVSILDYIDRGELIPFEIPAPLQQGPFSPRFHVKLYRCPSDPSYTYYPHENFQRGINPGDTSYAVNMKAFEGLPHLSKTFPDGTSNTIAFGEHYARCSIRDDFVFNAGGVVMVFPPESRQNINVMRRATFADQELGDVYPVTLGDQPWTIGSVPDKTFQVAPLPQDCDGVIPQTPHLSGMVTAMMDGSVRTISVNISPTVFWAIVTRDGGEISGSDW